MSVNIRRTCAQRSSISWYFFHTHKRWVTHLQICDRDLTIANLNYFVFNLLWPNDTIWWHGFESTNDYWSSRMEKTLSMKSTFKLPRLTTYFAFSKYVFNEKTVHNRWAPSTSRTHSGQLARLLFMRGLVASLLWSAINITRRLTIG